MRDLKVFHTWERGVEEVREEQIFSQEFLDAFAIAWWRSDLLVLSCFFKSMARGELGVA